MDLSRFTTAARDVCAALIVVMCLLGEVCYAGLLTVQFQAGADGGLVAHEAVRVSSDTFTNTIDYNSKPILAPFKAADGAGGRYAVHPDAAAVNLDWSYLALDGAGVFSFQSSGTTFVSGYPFAYGAGTFSTAGAHLPIAAHTGQLPTDLVLPNGLMLTAGTTLYSDLAGFHANYNNPADYWYDSAAHVEHRSYTGGAWEFFYESPTTPGQFLTLARYENVKFDWAINYQQGTLANTWSGTPVAVNGLKLPASISGYGLTSPLNTSGVLSNELTSPFTGFYGTFRDAFNLTLDLDRAEFVASVPEPPSLVLLTGALLCWPLRRLRRLRASSI